jgi:hypothetical protein
MAGYVRPQVRYVRARPETSDLGSDMSDHQKLHVAKK